MHPFLVEFAGAGLIEIGGLPEEEVAIPGTGDVLERRAKERPEEDVVNLQSCVLHGQEDKENGKERVDMSMIMGKGVCLHGG
jgi:hypothetical protein